MSEDLAGRSYAQVYRVSRRQDVHDYLCTAVERAGGEVLYMSPANRAPVYLGIQAPNDERIGVLCYPFRCNPPPIRGRAPDEHRSGRRRESRTVAGLETLIAFSPERLLAYVGFERRATGLGLDPPLRFRAVEVAATDPIVPGAGGGHELEEEFDLTSTEILALIAERARLAVAVRGGVAEHHLRLHLRRDPQVAAAELVVSPPGQNGGMAASRGVAISLFSGAGGLDLGVEAAGYHVAAAVEINHDSADTLEKNFSGLVSPVFRESILDVPTKELLRAAGLKGRQGPELLVGGPPCTPFSKSGFWLEWKRAGLDPDASLLQAYTRVLAEAKPRNFILENVYALTYNNRASRPPFERLLREIDKAGYACSWAVLNAAGRAKHIRARGGDPWAVVTSPLGHSTWLELSALHRRTRASSAGVPVAEPVLVVPAEARSRASFADGSSPTRPECRSIPLGRSPPARAGATEALHVP